METESAYNEWLTGFSRLIYSEKAVTQVALAQRVNVDKGYINSILKGRKNAGFHLQEAISRALGMSHRDVRNVGREVLGLPQIVEARQCLHLIYGPADETPVSSVSASRTGVNRGTVAGVVSASPAPADAPDDPAGDDFLPVPKAAAKLSAGGGFQVEEGFVGQYHFRSAWLRRLCNPAHAVLFDCVGDSMEPTIRGDETVLVDMSRREIEDGGIYALGVDDAALIKRLRRTPAGLVRIISDNAAAGPEGPPVRPDEIRILGRVVWHGGEVK